MTKKTTPVHRIRHGRVEAAIWKNDGEKGPFHNVTFKRSYKTQDGEYRDVHAYGQRDLYDLSSCLLEAQLWINTAEASPVTRRRKASI